jgi:mRNA-degrading endonuclease RelE of RelBE toxin-antitoxin system
MKKVITTLAVDSALRTLGDEERRQVFAWLDHLKNWDNDQFLRANSYQLPGEPGAYMLRTSSDIRIFFSLDSDTITVLDVAKKQAIMTTTTASPQGSHQ